MLPASCLLKEGARIDVRVIHAESPAEFWLRPLQRPPSDGPALLSDLEASICCSRTAQPARQALKIGSLYAVTPEEDSDGAWSRGRLLDLPTDHSGLLLLIDHGRRALVPCRRLRVLQKRFERPSPHAVRCALSGLSCSDLEQWTPEVSQQFSELASAIIWRAAIRERTEATGGREEDTKLRISLTRSHSSLGRELPWADCGPFQDLDLLELLTKRGILARE